VREWEAVPDGDPSPKAGEVIAAKKLPEASVNIDRPERRSLLKKMYGLHLVCSGGGSVKGGRLEGRYFRQGTRRFLNEK